MHKLIKESKKELLIIFILLLLIGFGIVLILNISPKKIDDNLIDEEKVIRDFPSSLDIANHPEDEKYYIPLEFLNEEELIDLDLDTNTRAQILRRDPLVYKIINSDEDIVDDISIYMKPMREE